MVPLYILKSSAFTLRIFSGTWSTPKKSLLLHSTVLWWPPWSMTDKMEGKSFWKSWLRNPSGWEGWVGHPSLLTTLPALEMRESAFCIVLQGDPSCWTFVFCFVLNIEDFSQCKWYSIKGFFLGGKGRRGKWGLQCPLYIIFFDEQFFPLHCSCYGKMNKFHFSEKKLY